MKNQKSYTPILSILLIVAIIVFGINLSLGSVYIDLKTVFNSFFSNSDNYSNHEFIIQNYRLPKAITAIMVGSGLGISGYLMQTLFRNPLAGPFVLGVTSGASLGVAFIIMGASLFGGVLATVSNSPWSIVIASSLGSFIVLSAVLVMATRVKDSMALLIIGLMFSSITGAVVSVLSYFSNAQILQQYTFWGFGSLGNLQWHEVGIFFIIYCLGIALTLMTLKSLNVLLLGENYAKSMGLNVKKSRLLIILATCLLSGSITAFAGPIAFIGLTIPHIARQVFNTSQSKVLLPAVFLIGAIIMLICDSIAQLPTSDYTLPINTITSLFGAPIVIWLLVKKQKMIF